MSLIALDVAVNETASEPQQEVDGVESIIQTCGGDPRAAVRELLADTDFLRGELYTASCLLSRGIGRGWRPRYERT